MNKQLKFMSRTVFGMFIVLFFAVTMIQFVQADELRNDALNQRTVMNSYKIERGAILVGGDPIAYSTPTDDEFRFAREYPEGALYAPVTGYFSHTQGMTGLESAMNQDLSGTGDAQFFSRVMNTLTGVKPQGSSVETTINDAAQRAAYNGLVDLGVEGAAVAIDPSTGKILALASTPSFDPTLLSSNDSAEIITNYRQLQDDPNRPLINRAIGGDLYHPGSVYKVVTTAAAIESGEAKPDTEFDNPARLPLPQSNAVIQNEWRGTCGPGDKVDLEQALIRSCNIPMAELAMSMDRDEIPQTARAFGFEQDLTIPMPVTPSVAPNPLDDAQAAISAIGQLDVRTTPMQMAMVSAGIANDGVVMQPQLVDQVMTPDLQVERDFSPEEFSRPLSEDSASTLSSMMEKAVSDPNAVASPAAISGVEVAGKTGTAENGLDADGNSLPYTLWFTGFAPLEDPEIAVAVVVADGGGEAHGYAGTSGELPTKIGKQMMEAVLSE